MINMAIPMTGISLSEASNYLTEFKIYILEAQNDYEFNTCLEYE